MTIFDWVTFCPNGPVIVATGNNKCPYLFFLQTSKLDKLGIQNVNAYQTTVLSFLEEGMIC